MTIDEWKQKLIKKGQPHYTHFDRRTSLDKCWSYIDSPNKVCHHAFYPFIHYTIVSRKIQNAKKADPKSVRLIMPHIWTVGFTGIMRIR